MKIIGVGLGALVVSVLAVTATAEETVLRGLSPEQAVAKIREMKANKSFPNHDVVVELDGTFSYPEGSFNLESNDGGVSPSARVVFRGGKKGAVLTGAACVSRAALKKVTDSAVLARLRPEARDKVLCCDLKALGQKSFTMLPDQLRAWNSMELFADGEAQTLARYPNEGWLEFGFGDVVDSGCEINKDLKEKRGVRGGTFRYAADDPRPGTWDVSKGIWALGYWNNDWTSDTLRLAKIDGQEHTVTTKGVHYLGIGPFSKETTVKRRYFFLNVFEELDAPGEWYVDCEKGLLYWYPPKKDFKDVKFVNHPQPIVKAEKTRNLAFENITFECNTDSGLYLHDCANVTIDNCEVAYITRVGVHVQGGTEIVLSNSSVHHIGANGIYMEAGNRRNQIPCKNRITNCDIYRVGRFVTSSRGIELDGVGTRIDHNYIHDIPYIGITFRGNDHVIEFNEIAFVLMESGDGGGLYTGRDWTSQGNITRWNYLHHFGALGAQEKLRRGEKLFCEPLKKDDSNGIYFDDCDSGDQSYGNLIFQVGYGYQLGGGRDNYVHDNFIAGCMYASALVDARGYKALRFEESNRSLNGWNMVLRLKNVNWDKPSFRDKYPWTADYLTNDKFFPVRTSFSSNIVVNCKSLFVASRCDQRKDFVHEMNIRNNRFFGPKSPRDQTLYPDKQKDQYDSHCVFAQDAELEKLVANATDLRKVVTSAAFKKRFPNFPKIPVDEIGLQRNPKRK